jgi:hypothetical protein
VLGASDCFFALLYIATHLPFRDRTQIVENSATGSAFTIVSGLKQ